MWLQLTGPSESQANVPIDHIHLLGTHSAIMMVDEDCCHKPPPLTSISSSGSFTTSIRVPSSPKMDNQQDHHEIQMKIHRNSEIGFENVDSKDLQQSGSAPQQNQKSAFLVLFTQDSTSISSNDNQAEVSRRNKIRMKAMYVSLISEEVQMY